MIRQFKHFKNFIRPSLLRAACNLQWRHAHKRIMDGNEAAAWCAYACSDCAFIYPITPASPMAEHMDAYSAQGKKNLFNTTVTIREMQSEAGAVGAVHGSVNTGALTSTFTSSQGLMLMIPNMFKMAVEGVPTVFHVASRSMIRSLGTMYVDHSDVMATRSTGFALLSSANVQEAMDLAFVSHISALKGKVPFLHFFDGFRTSHEISKIDVIDYDEMEKVYPKELVTKFRRTAFNQEHPTTRGGAVQYDVWWQWTESILENFNKLPDIVEETMNEVAKVTGRHYKPYQYFGHPEAERVIVIMGSASKTTKETVEYLWKKKGEKVGMVQVRLFRPFSTKKFLNEIPSTAKKISVMDRVREFGAHGQPLYLDVVTASTEAKDGRTILSGIYGISGKDFTPGMVMSIFKNMEQENPKNHFTVGLKDDKYDSALPEHEEVNTVPEGTKQLIFYGIGGDGTIGANREAMQIISENTKKYMQGYFMFDAKKTNGFTVSHLRFSDKPIESEYEIKHADYVAVHHPTYVTTLPVLRSIKEGGIFVLNSPCKTIEEFEKIIPPKTRQIIAKRKIKFYNIDATNLAEKYGLKGRTNMIMQSVFFKLCNDLIDENTARKQLVEGVQKMYGLKGKDVVEKNIKLIDVGFSGKDLQKVEYPESWANATGGEEIVLEKPKLDEDGNIISKEEYVRKIVLPYFKMKGEDMPVSFFDGIRYGAVPTGTSKYEKRGVATNIPVWDPEKCIKCNLCTFVCPHSALRPFLLNNEELEKAKQMFGDSYKYLTESKATKGYNYKIQVSPMDCMDCGLCVYQCPKDALHMESIKNLDIETEKKIWEYDVNLPERGEEFKKTNVQGTQYQTPLLEFAGACSGCPEASYMKVLTQLFGKRMIIANATGCSIIWGATLPCSTYTTDSRGHGPAWGNSLFEDNAEYGYGMAIAIQQRRKMLLQKVDEALAKKDQLGLSDKIVNLFQEWKNVYDKGEESRKVSIEIQDWMATEGKDICAKDKLMNEIFEFKDVFTKPSIWIVGGDGFAYDIGFGGLDHVLAQDIDINMFIYDNQSYANTGFQMSKSTPFGAKAKFAAMGKQTGAKNLALQMMTYGHVYVAQVAMGADQNQFLRAIREAEAYPGPSLVIGYTPCTGHGIKGGLGNAQKVMEQAVKAGFWNLFRYNPEKQGNYPFTLDYAKEPQGLQEYLENEVRFSSLKNTAPQEAERLQGLLEQEIKQRYEKLVSLSKSKTL